MTQTISLTKGLSTIVDDDDYEQLIKYSWYAKKNHKKYYAQRRSGFNHYQMHNEILPHSAGVTVDHINGDSLDNRKCNLRLATQKEQCFNRQKSSGTSSIYKGVSFHKGKRKWTAQIKIDGITHCLGTFINEEDAAMAYDRKAIELFGEFAQTNLTPDQIHEMAMDLLEQEHALREQAEKRWGQYSKQETFNLFG